MTLTRMMEIATRYANGEEQDRLCCGKSKPLGQETGGGNSNRKQNHKAGPAAPGEIAVVAQGKFKGKPKGPYVGVKTGGSRVGGPELCV